MDRITLNPGMYVVSFGVEFAHNTAGRRIIAITDEDSTSPSGLQQRENGVSTNASGDGGTILRSSEILYPTETRTYVL